jgi:hypothetical protein
MTDFERQQAIDLLLGVYVPNKNEKPIWEVPRPFSLILSEGEWQPGSLIIPLRTDSAAT